MTPKELAEKLIDLSKRAEPTWDLTGCYQDNENLVHTCSPDNIQSLAAAYLKTVECLIVISKMRGTTKNGSWTIAREALREMGES